MNTFNFDGDSKANNSEPEKIRAEVQALYTSPYPEDRACALAFDERLEYWVRREWEILDGLRKNQAP